MAANISLPPLLPFNPPPAGDGINTSQAFSTTYIAVPSLGSAGDIFTAGQSEQDEPDLDGVSDDDEEMSDGGAQIDMSSTHAKHLNDEMDMVDAEVMGSYNLTAIAASSTFLSGIYTQVANLNDLPDHLASEGAGAVDYEPANMENDDQESVISGTHISDPMSEVSQQLQSLQDGQEQGEMFTSIPAHGTFLHHSTEPLSSILPGGLGDGEANILDMSDVSPSVVDLSVADATAGSLLDSFTDGQSIHGTQLTSDVGWGDWGDEGGSDQGSDPDHETLANPLQVDDHRNLNLHDFLTLWAEEFPERVNGKKNKSPRPNLRHLSRLRAERPFQVRFSDLNGEKCDIQGINWDKLEVSRREARKRRGQKYQSYTNLWPPPYHKLTLQQSIIMDSESYFKFQRMDFKPRIFLSHFQLRNLIACTSRNNVCYAGESKVYSVNPLFDKKAVRLDLTDPVVQTTNALTLNGIQISTIAADHNVLIAGGFAGEFGMTSLDSQVQGDHTEGIITIDPNPITNHIQIHLNRHSGLPRAAFASNDNFLRILDCASNTMVGNHHYDYAINCSAISPDHRLRVVVGDHKDVMICEAENGEILQKLSGHVDYGFACAWADNGWHVATGNQDKLIKIWDARMWTNRGGIGQPLQTISATVSGVRSLKFSPLGSGKRVLVAAEAADVVNVINAETYGSKQTLEFFGEICGVDFTPDGQALFVGIYDALRGGIMEFEKCGFGGLDGRGRFEQAVNAANIGKSVASLLEDSVGLDWKSTNDEVVRDPRSRRTATHRRRKAARSWDMDPF